MGSPAKRHALAGLCALLAAALATGCGGGSSTAASSSQPSAAATTAQTQTTTQPASTSPATTHTSQHAHASVPTVAEVKISSPALQAEALPARYTCDGANISPPLSWRGIPPGTVELMLDVINLKPLNNQLHIDWAVAGIDPNSTGTAAGTLPPGAILGTNSSGHTAYSLCPPHHHEDYLTVLFALPRHLHVKPGFNAAALRHEAVHTAEFEGFLFFHYTRR